MCAARSAEARSVVLGFRAHTGWAAAVALETAPPRVVERRRIVYEPHAEATRFLYHRAAELGSEKAPRLIADGRMATVAAAKAGVEKFVAELGAQGYRVTRAAIPAGNTKLPAQLSDILAAHSRIHAAEGAFYRDTLGEACTALGLSVSHLPERDLRRLAADALKRPPGTIDAFLDDLGRGLGPPWAEDQKLASLAALVAGAPGARPSLGVIVL